VKTLEYARHACAKFEPLVAVLAEEDWRDLGPPETDYLNEEATRERLAEMVYELIMPVAETASSALDGVIAMFSHLDVSFRHGVSGMVEYWLPTVRRGLPLYIPATMVGNPSLQ
jgi:hypothetical protein